MNAIQRIQSTLQGMPTDRRAISLTLSLYGARLTHCPLTDYYTDPVAYARGQQAVRETFAPDVLFAPFSLPLEGASFGSKIRIYTDHAPNLRQPVLTSIADLPRLTVPDIDNHPIQHYFTEAIRLMVRDHGGEVPIAAIALSPVDLPAMLLGIEGWLDTLLFNPDGTQALLNITVPYFVRRANALFKAGATFIVLPTPFVNPYIVTRNIAEQMISTVLKPAFAQINGPLVIHATGAPLTKFLDLFTDLPNVVGFVLNNSDDPTIARQKIGPEPVLIGTIEGPELVDQTPTQIEADCMALLQTTQDDPRFILGTSGADVRFDTPINHILLLRQCAEAFAQRRPA